MLATVAEVVAVAFTESGSVRRVVLDGGFAYDFDRQSGTRAAPRLLALLPPLPGMHAPTFVVCTHAVVGWVTGTLL